MAIVPDKSFNNPYVDAHIERPYVITRAGKTTTIDRSMTATIASTQLMAANSRRQSMSVRNDSAVDVYINFGGPAVATIGGGNIKLAASGGSWTSTDQRAVQILAVSGTAPVTASETV